MHNTEVCEKILISEQQIQKRVSEIGQIISKDYENKEIIFISVLNGSFMFTSDLMKCISVDCSVDFIQISTYGNGTSSSGEFIIKKDLSFDIAEKNVIVVEDIIDSGYTISKLYEYLQQRNPASLKIATFIDKPTRRKENVEADYVCFNMDNDDFIVGYGLDYSQKYRNLPFVGALNKEIYS